MKQRSSAGSEPAIDHNADRHPEFTRALRRILEEAELPEGPVERIELNFLASGECTYRLWAPRAEESTGGYLPAE